MFTFVFILFINVCNKMNILSLFLCKCLVKLVTIIGIDLIKEKRNMVMIIIHVNSNINHISGCFCNENVWKSSLNLLICIILIALNNWSCGSTCNTCIRRLFCIYLSYSFDSLCLHLYCMLAFQHYSMLIST